jgi:hypothetical protein
MKKLSDEYETLERRVQSELRRSDIAIRKGLDVVGTVRKSADAAPATLSGESRPCSRTADSCVTRSCVCVCVCACMRACTDVGACAVCCAADPALSEHTIRKLQMQAVHQDNTIQTLQETVASLQSRLQVGVCRALGWLSA